MAITPNRAREIMGPNFFGPDAGAQHLKITPLARSLSFLSTVPFSEELLLQVKDTHLLTAMHPVSIMDLYKNVPKLFHFSLSQWCPKVWFTECPFALEQEKVGWKLTRKTTIPDSGSLSWEFQQGLLKTEEYVPTATAMIYAILGHYLATEERLLPDNFARTMSVLRDIFHIYVGLFNGTGIFIGYHAADLPKMGLSSGIKES